MAQNIPRVAVKVSPALDYDAIIPPTTAEVEIISLRGEAKEALLWLGGFRTLEKRAGAIREGFEIEALGGGREILASKKLLSASVLNKYGLNLRALENTALGALETAAASGKMLSRGETFGARLKFRGGPG